MIVLKNTPINQIFYILRNSKNGSGCWDLTHSNVEYNSNGTFTIAPPEGYDGLSSVTVKVDVKCSGITTSESEINSSNDGGDYTIGISSGYSWTATASEDWITVTPSSGEGGVAVVVITVSENEGDERTGTVTIVNDNGDVNVIEITQKGSLSDYLTIEALTGGNLLYSYKEGAAAHLDRYKEIEYSTDKINWNSVSSPSTIAEMTAGDKIYLRGNNPAYSGLEYSDRLLMNVSYWNYFTGSNGLTVKLSGNIMSLIQKEDFDQLTELTADRTFSNLFEGLDVVDAGDLLLPATTLTYDCYGSMFMGCSNLTVVPELPATALAAFCYSNMFRGCTSLTTAPELPATTLARDCYSQMFAQCSSLVNAPALPSTTLAEECYSMMFSGCTSLTTAPDLPATVLAIRCYSSMFLGCTSLNYIKCFAVEGIDIHNVGDWTRNVAAEGTFVKDENANWPINTPWSYYGIPSGWTVETI